MRTLGDGAGGLEEWDFSSRCEVCDSCLGICLEKVVTLFFITFSFHISVSF